MVKIKKYFFYIFNQVGISLVATGTVGVTLTGTSIYIFIAQAGVFMTLLSVLIGVTLKSKLSNNQRLLRVCAATIFEFSVSVFPAGLVQWVLGDIINGVPLTIGSIALCLLLVKYEILYKLSILKCEH
jgi:hypothetical protein